MNSLSKTRAKEKAQTLKETLAKLGHEVGIRHCYEVIAKQSGFSNWNAMSAQFQKEEPSTPSAQAQLDRLREISINGLHEAYESFDDWEYDFIADFSWRESESTKQIMELLHHKEFKQISETIESKYNYDVYSFLSRALKQEEPEVDQILNESVFDLVEKGTSGIGDGSKVYEFEVHANAKVKAFFKVRGNHPGHAYNNLDKYISENEAAVFSGEDWEVQGNIGITEYWKPDIGHQSGLHKTRNIVPVHIETDDDKEKAINNESGISWQSVQRES